MALFVRKPVLIATEPDMARAAPIRWDYDRAEMIADGIVHAIGVISGLVAAITLVVLSGVFSTPANVAAVLIYVAGLLSMLGFSAAYNLWPVSPRKWLLRRFDHSAIYVLIAATYTPFMAQMTDTGIGWLLLATVWGVAVIGILLKLFLPGRFDRLSIGLYLALGWSGVMAYDTVSKVVPGSALAMIAIGGILYSLGVIFHVWERLRFQNAIWHGFVLSGAACHYTAVLDLVLP
jgi:hemolysin III